MGSSGNRTARLRLALLAIVGATLVLAAPAHAAFPGANGKIAFSRSSPSDQIYSVNPDGTGEVKLSNYPGAIDHDPAWSPDGRRIAFIGYHRDVSGPALYVMNSDGSGARMVVAGAAYHPAWSPDGRKIVFGSDGTIEIWVVNVDGSGLTRLTEDGATIDEYPAWSPDDQKIAFVTNRNSSVYRIWLMDADGNNETALTTTGSEYPRWSPDGTKIAFSHVDSSGYQVWVMNADGTNPVQKTFDGGNLPVWSPDGTKIAFARDVDPGYPSDWVVYVMNADGSGITPVVRGLWLDWQPLPAGGSGAPYEMPYEAPSVRAALVPVFRQCGSGGNPVSGRHSPPLATGSCTPPKPGSVAHFGPQSTGSAELAVAYGDTTPLNGDQADMIIRLSLTDVQTALGADYDPESVGLDTTLITRLRFTDSVNGGSGTDPGTATDLDFSVPVACTATADTSLGSACSVNTTADSVMPGVIQENKATVLQTFRFRLNDAGANGVQGDSDDRIFATQGAFVP